MGLSEVHHYQGPNNFTVYALNSSSVAVGQSSGGGTLYFVGYNGVTYVIDSVKQGDAWGFVYNGNPVFFYHWFGSGITATGGDFSGLSSSNPSGNIPTWSNQLYDVDTLLTEDIANSGDWILEGETITSNIRLEYSSGFSPLPVDLVYFQAHKVGRNARLDWTTASELNNAGFEIQRSFDGVEWHKVGYIAGAGTTQSTQHYTWMDRNTLSGVYYYRLKQTDFNGEYEYSPVVSFRNMESEEVEVSAYPNPVQDNLNLRFENHVGKVLVSVVSATGQELKVFAEAVKDGSIQIPLDQPSGIYHVRVVDAESNKLLTVKTVMKN